VCSTMAPGRWVCLPLCRRRRRFSVTDASIGRMRRSAIPLSVPSFAVLFLASLHLPPIVHASIRPSWNDTGDLTATTFVDSTGTDRTCDWLADQIMIDFDAAMAEFCHPPGGYRLPLSAVICPETCRRQAPTECSDTNALLGDPFLESESMMECEWLGESMTRLLNYCSSAPGISTRADAACPKTCAKCLPSAQLVIPPPSPAPIRALSQSPTIVPEKTPTESPTASVVETAWLTAPETSPPTLKCPAIPYTRHDKDDTITLRRSGRPDRKFRIYTPANFDRTKPSKVVFMFHGWTRGTYCQGRIFLQSQWRAVADEHNYVLVGVDGLAENERSAPRSFTFPGSADGLGRDGRSITTCRPTYGPDYCYPSCERLGRCSNRCGWTHCLDDDFQFFIDLVDEVANKYVCLDRARVYVYGYSMGGMFVWSLGQNPRTSRLIAGMGAVMGLPMHDHLSGKGDETDLPVIGIYGDRDCSVPPGDGRYLYNEVCDDDGYLYVDAFHQHGLWASEHGCSVGSSHPARYSYDIPGRNEISCASHCDPANGPPPSVDCRYNAEHGKEAWHLDAVLKFFEDHSARSTGTS